MLSQSSRYYLPEPSHWPVIGSIALFIMALGATFWMNGLGAGPWLVAAGLAVLVYMLFGWFGVVIRESEGGKYNRQVDVSFRWAMSWFIFSEVMFFAASLAPCSTCGFCRCPRSAVATRWRCG
jgi:cytochrome c oxidase subunit 3